MAGLRRLLGSVAAAAVLTGCLGDPVTPVPTYEWYALLQVEEGWEEIVGEGGELALRRLLQAVAAEAEAESS